MSSLPSLFRKFSATDLFDEIPQNIDANILKKAAQILNEHKYPLEKRTITETSNILEENFSSETVKEIMALLKPIPMLCRISDDYEELKEMIAEFTKSVENEKLKNDFQMFYDSLAHLKKYYSHKRLEGFKTRANCYYQSMEYTCNLRGRFSKDFNNKSSSIENYIPEIHDIIPMISLCFNTSNGEDSSNFIFDVEEKELDEVILNLMAAQKDIKALKNKVGE